MEESSIDKEEDLNTGIDEAKAFNKWWNDEGIMYARCFSADPSYLEDFAWKVWKASAIQ